MDLSGHNLEYIADIASEYYCQQKCQENAACQYFTYNKNANTAPLHGCWLKDNVPGTLSSYTGLISGPSYCGNCNMLLLLTLSHPGNLTSLIYTACMN